MCERAGGRVARAGEILREIYLRNGIYRITLLYCLEAWACVVLQSCRRSPFFFFLVKAAEIEYGISSVNCINVGQALHMYILIV